MPLSWLESAMIGVSADGAESAAVDDSLSDLDVALAHWHVNAWGGAEYLVTKLAEVLEVDRIYTTGAPVPDDLNPYGDVEFYDVAQDLSPAPLRRLQSQFGRVFEYALWEDVDWREYGHPDVLVTSGATTRAVITPDDTPARQLLSLAAALVLRPLSRPQGVSLWDACAAARRPLSPHARHDCRPARRPLLRQQPHHRQTSREVL